ncbi:MAG: hypothetical protein K2X82_19265 [Gemmataceae bacterium]|nr:hypothetical protein [Gemmataceae bacterium]
MLDFKLDKNWDRAKLVTGLDFSYADRLSFSPRVMIDSSGRVVNYLFDLKFTY